MAREKNGGAVAEGARAGGGGARELEARTWWSETRRWPTREDARAHTRGGRGTMAREDGAAKERAVAGEDGATEERAEVAGEDHSTRRWPEKIEAQRQQLKKDEGT